MHRSLFCFLVVLPILNLSGCGSVQTDSPSWPAERSLTVNPDTLTLPTGGFHYDPLLTLKGGDGQPIWLDLPEQVGAVSSNPQAATVNARVRVRTTDLAGSSEISLALLEDPAVRTLFRLTTVDAAVAQVKLDGPDHFELFVGQSIPLEATAVLTSGHVIPHAQYSSDLDLLQGAQYAAVVDGLGVTALQPTPSRTAITIGFARAGGLTNGTLSIRPKRLVDVQLSLGGLSEVSQGFIIPSGFQARLEALGTFEDGSRRKLQLGSDFSVRLTGDSGFLCTPPGFLSQPLPQQNTLLQLQLSDRVIEANVTTVDGSAPLRLSADFANYPEDRHLLLGDRGYARELRVLADFAGLERYRLSSLDGLSSSTPNTVLGASSDGWPTLAPVSSSASSAQLTLAGHTTFLAGLRVVEPNLEVRAVGRRTNLPIELGSTLFLQTMLNHGEGPVNRSSDYPAGGPDRDVLLDSTREFLNQAGTQRFQVADAQGQSLPSRMEVRVVRQSDPD